MMRARRSSAHSRRDDESASRIKDPTNNEQNVGQLRPAPGGAALGGGN